MIDNPYETRSDSFYFVDDKLIMHNKADYAYNGGLHNQWLQSTQVPHPPCSLSCEYFPSLSVSALECMPVCASGWVHIAVKSKINPSLPCVASKNDSVFFNDLYFERGSG